MATTPPTLRRISITTLLTVTITALVAVAILVLLAISFFNTRSNTVNLLYERSETILQGLDIAVRDLMTPAENQLTYIADVLQQSRGDLPSQRIGDLLTGAMAGTPQIVRLIHLTPALRATIAERGTEGPEVRSVDLGRDETAQRLARDVGTRLGGYWSELSTDSILNSIVITRRHPVWVQGRFAGVLVAFVSMRRLSETIARQASGSGATGFILFDRNQVLAYPQMTRILSQRNRPNGRTPEGGAVDLPAPVADEAADPVLAAIGRMPAGSATPANQRLLGPEGRFFSVINVDGQDYAFIERQVFGYGIAPWRLGIYLPLESLTQELRRAMIGVLGGLVVLVLAVFLALLLGRAIARPIRGLAKAATDLRESEYTDFQELRPSRIREIDEQIQSFNVMQQGLRWFGAYVPRSLVRRILREPEADVTRSRDVTVLFTDIAGFTSLSENMDAVHTAQLLNEHFTLLTRAIEDEEGTIDKYIGDSVMAFWNAPKRFDDHADRAVRAALAIADAVAADNRARARRGEKPLRVRLGLHTGTALVGNIGVPGSRVNYTIVGDTVNTAERICELGKEILGLEDDTVVLASEATVSALTHSVPVSEASRVTLRGRAEPVLVYRVSPPVPVAHAGVA